MTRKELQALMKEHFIVDSELDDILTFVEDLLHLRRNAMVRNEPHAYRSIQSLDNAAEEVSDLRSYVENILEEDN